MYSNKTLVKPYEILSLDRQNLTQYFVEAE
jgi:hypothetical protein